MARRSSSISSKGLSLAELLLVMALLLVVTGLMAGLVRGYSETLRFAEGKAHTVDVAQEALGRMTAEVSEATWLDDNLTDTLKLKRVNPAMRATRLPGAGSADAPDPWQPFAEDYLLTVTYECQAEEWLTRTVDSQSLRLADNIAGLSVRRSGNRLVTLSISTREGRQLRSISTCVCLPTNGGAAP